MKRLRSHVPVSCPRLVESHRGGRDRAVPGDGKYLDLEELSCSFLFEAGLTQRPKPRALDASFHRHYALRTEHIPYSI